MNNTNNKNRENDNEMNEKNNEEILTNIQQLQELENQLFQKFNNIRSTASVAEKQELIKKINHLSTMRINLYKTLNNLNGFYQKTLDNSIDTMKEQNVAIGIVESELNKSKRELTLLEAERNNKLRLIEINNYYGERYAEHASLLKIIICILLPLICLTILWRYLPLPKFLYYALVAVVAIVGAYYFWAKYASIMTRNNMNYQTYDWYFNPGETENVNSTSNSDTNSDPWLNPNPLTCIGAECCTDGLQFDTNTNACVLTTTKTTENYQNLLEQILTKKNKTREDFNIQGNMIQSFN